jgi:hypothetical protein
LFSVFRKEVKSGLPINTRHLVVDILPHKREQMLDTLTGWKAKADFTLKEVSSLHGTLESLSQYNRWGRACFFPYRMPSARN